MNPDGSEYDIATGSYRIVAQEPPAERRLERGRHRPQPQLGRSTGAAAAARAARSRRRPTAARRRSRPRRPSACATSSTAAWSAASSRSRPASTSTRYSELVLWPYGYTTANTTPDAERRRTQTRSRRSASRWPTTNGYTPEQASDLYITDGSIDDWLWGVHGIFGYTFEMYPRTSNPGFYPPDEVIAPRDDPQPRRRAAAARGRRLPVPGDRQGGAVLRRPAPAGDALQRRLRDGPDGLDAPAHRDRRRASSAVTRPRRPPTAPSSSARPPAASTTS